MGKARRSRKKASSSTSVRSASVRRVGRSVGQVVVTTLVTLVVLSAGGTAALAGWSRWSHSALDRSKGLVVEVGDSSDVLAVKLADAGFVSAAWLMELYLGTLGKLGRIRPGSHWIPPNASPRTIAQCLSRVSGRPTADVLFPEGFEHVRAAQRLEQKGICQAKDFIAAVRNQSLLERLTITGPDAEGYLFPANYTLFVDSEPFELLQRFVNETRQRLRKVDARLGGGRWERLSTERGWGEREILTLASMVEKEAGVDDERATIASVFFNRLDSTTFRPRKMLQSDPTAGYGCLVHGERLASCRDYQHRILPVMLRDGDNPYNTYRRPGLPPGPIASPGEASIESVLNPAKTDYLFFVASGNGRHRFSRNLEDHEARIRGDEASIK